MQIDRNTDRRMQVDRRMYRQSPAAVQRSSKFSLAETLMITKCYERDFCVTTGHCVNFVDQRTADQIPWTLQELHSWVDGLHASQNYPLDQANPCVRRWRNRPQRDRGGVHGITKRCAVCFQIWKSRQYGSLQQEMEVGEYGIRGGVTTESKL